MPQKPWKRFWLAVVLWAYCLSLPIAGAGAGPASTSVFSQEGAANEREFYTSNKDNRFLLKIHVWGDVALSGIHHVPDNTTLLDVIGYAGGPSGLVGGFSKASITLSRKMVGKEQPVEISFDGKDLVRKIELRNMRITSDDVIYVETPKPDTLLPTLTLIGTILGILTSSAGLYLLATR